MASDRSGNVVATLGDKLRSLRLTIVLFLFLAAASVLGTLVPQNLAPEEYGRIYGAVAAQFFLAANITDLYHSVWFIALQGLLVLNLIACSIHRLPATWKSIRTPQRPLTDGLWKSLPVRRHLAGDEAPESVARAISEEMVRRRWTLREERVAGAVHLLAQKGKYGRMGVYVTHLGVVVILLGAALGFALGFKGFVQIHEGETVGRVQDRQSRAWRDLSFQVRCDRFEMAVYPDGTPKEYRSDIAFLQNGQVKLEGPLRVNHPLQFGGYVFYQASYGSSAKVTLEVGKDGGGAVRQATLELGETTGLDPQGQSLIRPMRYESNLQGRGPALLVAYLKAGGQPATGWLFKGDRGAVLEGWNLRFVEAQERRWTGIQVKNDPGVWVVWVGCGLVMLGCALAFLVSHRRVWVRIEEGSGQTTCRVGGSASKNVPGFARKVEELCRVWERRAGLRATDGRKGNE